MSKYAKKTFWITLYQTLVLPINLILILILQYRIKKGKENKNRLHERFGKPIINKPHKKIFWIHGASVGESLSIIPLLQYILEKDKDLFCVFTTQTVSSAELLADILPKRVIHQFCPIDHPKYINKFLNHWQPSLAIFIESEIWPNMLELVNKRQIPLALINARMSPKSFQNWLKFKQSFIYIMSLFNVIIAQDSINTQRFAKLNIKNILCLGNLKITSPTLSYDKKKLSYMQESTKNYSLWLGASTHEGEEKILLTAQKILSFNQNSKKRTLEGKIINPIKLIIVPRHPQRGKYIKNLCNSMGLSCAQRSKNQEFNEKIDIYIADSLGEMGIFYRLCKIVFIGGSLIPKGGHNPLEPARLNNTILHGPHFFNFEDIYKEFRKNLASAQVRNSDDIVQAVSRLLQDPITSNTMAKAANKVVSQNSQKILSNLNDILSNLLEKNKHVS